MSQSHGQFVWYELMTTDMAAAEAFYRAVVGWAAQDMSQDESRYVIFNIDGQGAAGLMTIPPPAAAAGLKPHWSGYICVDDVDDYAKRIVEAGGQLHHGPEDIPNVGRFASLTDPHGAGFQIFKPFAEMTPPEASDRRGRIDWHELMAGELESAFAFYSGLFGWTKKDAVDMGAMGVYQLFATDGGEANGGMMTKPSSVPGRPFWSYYINVDSATAAVKRIEAGEGTLLNGPMQVPGGQWIVQAQDPQGAMFRLVSSEA